MTETTLAAELPKWLRSVELVPGGGRQSAILSAANDLSDSVEGRAIMDVVCLAHGMANDSAYDSLTKAIQAHDSTFGCLVDDLETQIAAGAAVAAMLEKKTPTASIAAEAVLSAAWMGFNSSVEPLPALARAASRRRSEGLRGRRTALPRVSAVSHFRESPSFAEEGQEDQPAPNKSVALLRTAAEKSASSYQTSHNKLVAALEVRLNAADEELDVLWWAFSGFCNLADRRWTEIEKDGAPILAGLELASKLTFDIELPSTKDLLSRVIPSAIDEAVMLGDAVEAAGTHVKNVPSTHILLPVLSGISKHNELQGGAAWREVATQFGVDLSASRSAIDLACQSTREMSLAGKI